jgi:hypothetical protein
MLPLGPTTARKLIETATRGPALYLGFTGFMLLEHLADKLLIFSLIAVDFAASSVALGKAIGA